MTLLIDSDAFCKLVVSDLLREAAQALGAELEECRRLPALPHMLRRGGLRRRYGGEASDAMLRVAERLPSITEPSSSIWLDPLVPVQAIDPGEALIFAAAAESGAMIVSGDKRALEALKELEDHREALEGKIVALEAVLLELCRSLGSDLVRKRIQPLVDLDTGVRACFSSEDTDPEEGLSSYLNDLMEKVFPLILWQPP